MTTNVRRKSAGEGLPDIALVPADMLTVSAAAREQLRQVLMQLKLTQLRALAKARQVVVRGSQRETLVAALLAHLLDPAASAALLVDLQQPGRAILALALVLDWTGNHAVARDIARVLHRTPATGIDQALAQLGELGFMLPPVTASARYELGLHLPAALAPGLLPLLPEIRAYSGDLPPAVETAADSEGALQDAPALRKIDALLAALPAGDYRLAEAGPRLYRDQVTRLLGHWDVLGEVPAGRPRLAPDERPVGIQVATGAPLFASDGLARLQAAAGLASADETTFFVQLLLALGLLLRSGPGLLVQAAAVDQFQARSPRARLLQALAALLALNGWSEIDPLLAHDPALGLFRNNVLHYVEPLHLRNEVARIRQAVVMVLAWLPAGSWYDVESLLTALHSFFPELPVSLQPRAGGWEQVTWWLERADGAGGWQYLNRRNGPDWLRGLGRLAGTTISGPLTWFGLVETTRLDGTPPPAAQAGLPAGFHLTPLGGQLLSRRPAALLAVQPRPAGETPRPAVGPALHIQPDAGAALRLNLDPRAVPLADQIALAGCANPVRNDDTLCVYRLTPMSVRRGFEHGMDGPRLLAFLAPLAGGALPAGVAARIRAWWDTYGRLRFYTGVTLISFGDDFMLPELLTSTSLSNYLLHQFSPRLVAVPDNGVDRLLADLQRAGHTPRVVDESRPVPPAGGGGS